MGKETSIEVERASVSETPKNPQRTYRCLLDYFLSCYLDVTGYIQRMRNRQKALDKSTALGKWPREECEMSYVEVHLNRKKELEKLVIRELRKLKDYEWIQRWPGIGPVSAAILLSRVDIRKADTVSKLWKFCGLGVEEDGTRQRLMPGKRRTFCGSAKAAVLHYIGQMNLLRVQPYRGIYDTSYMMYKAKFPEWTKGHVHNAARRRMVKIYLEHLWVEWRRQNGLPVRAPYVIERMGHEHYVLAGREETSKTGERALEEETPTEHKRPSASSLETPGL
jgi:hypothetical protein